MEHPESTNLSGLAGCLALALIAFLFSAGILSQTNEALLSASESGHRDKVTQQLAYGANANASDRNGMTPLHFAALSGHLEVAELLLARGANIEASDKSGSTPLHYAALMGHMNIAGMLVSYGARTDTLNIAALSGNEDIARMLIASNADFSARERARIRKLTADHAALAENKLWQSVQSSEDALAAQSYLDRFPDGIHAAEARKKLHAIAARQEELLWQQAKDAVDIRGVQAYLDKYPDGTHAAEAKEKLSGIREAPPETDSALAEAASHKCLDCPEMIVIPAGSFEMGDAEPALRVTLKSFALSKTEVTQGQWKAVMGINPSHFTRCGDNCPVEQVSWNDVQKFIGKLNASTGKQYRLPSEAEWAYACMAGEQHEYCGSDNLDAVAWHSGNSGDSTHPVAEKQANAYGLHDMSGNVWEWVADNYHVGHEGAPTDGSAWQDGGEDRILLGGSWIVSPRVGKDAARNWSHAAKGYYNLGFRLAMTLP